jgi:hypothetical protein
LPAVFAGEDVLGAILEIRTSFRKLEYEIFASVESTQKEE